MPEEPDPECLGKPRNSCQFFVRLNFEFKSDVSCVTMADDLREWVGVCLPLNANKVQSSSDSQSGRELEPSAARKFLRTLPYESSLSDVLITKLADLPI